MKLITVVALLGLCAAKELGFGWNETLVGFYTQGSLPFEEAYTEGKSAKRSVSVMCEIIIPPLEQFKKDPLHYSQCVGDVHITGLTTQGLPTNGALYVFPHDVHDNMVTLVYNVTVSTGGQDYLVVATKHVYGYECQDLLYMMTHANLTITSQGKTWGTGMILLNFKGLMGQFLTMHTIGQGSDADKYETVAAFLGFVLGDWGKDCKDTKMGTTRFWYVWATDGTNGFLLDLISRESQLELRMEMYHNSILSKPVIEKAYFPLTDLRVNGDTVTMGTVTISLTGFNGTVNGIPVEGTWNMTGNSNMFFPTMVNASHGVWPPIYSQYGMIESVSVRGVHYSSIPMVYTTYTFLTAWELHMAQWSMISAMQFPGTDLQVEIMAVVLVGNKAVSTAFVRYNGAVYHVGKPEEVDMTATGASGFNLKRGFAASVKTTGLDLTLTCSALDSKFALLDKEGGTTIHTTVIGDCSAKVGTSTHECKGCALLEEKKMTVALE